MMTGEQRSKAAELRAAIAATAGTVNGAPHEVRQAVVELKREVQFSGATARELAEALGVHESTLCRWERSMPARAAAKKEGRGERATQGTSSFRLVKVAESGAARSAGAGGAMPVVAHLRVAHAPSGLMIEGLDIEGLAVLLRRLSC